LAKSSFNNGLGQMEFRLQLKLGSAFIMLHLKMVWTEMEMVKKNIDVRLKKVMAKDVKTKQRIKTKDVTLINKRVTITKRINYD
jgi:hypothetical protein